MGELIYLDARRAGRSRDPSATRPKFYFDVACPLSYLAAERVERILGEAEWVPTSAAAVSPQRHPDTVRELAGARATALRLPLVWPDWFGTDAPRALRAAAHASEIGAGGRFGLAATRLAFCGGFELDDPETLTEAAAAAGVPLNDCLQAAGDLTRDQALAATAVHLRARGVNELPALELDGRLLDAEAGLLGAVATRRHPTVSARPVQLRALRRG